MPKDRKVSTKKAETESAAKKSAAKGKAAGAKAKPAAKKVVAKKSAKAVSSEKTAVKKAAAKKTSSAKAAPKKKAAAPAKKAVPAKKTALKPRKAAKPADTEIESATIAQPAVIEDPIGDLGDGEGHRYLGGEAETELEEIDAEEAEPEETAKELKEKREGAPRPEPHPERLQKILSQAGIASRRHAEEMILAGRVLVNGQAVTQLGAKADPEQDHIRVDGKLIQRLERHRTFVLNKPRGYVTTVSDPEGRATVMDFFAKTRERLYPVGRLDYLSDGLLLMTNDGELANLLTRASSQVEKTYVVKVAGQLSDEQLDRLREGVSIEKGEQGSQRVRTAPAEVHLIRPGDNPWYEVILIEGRNREIRKMFSITGHFVEKIRRVGYGPIVLDVEPGQFRELTPEELRVLRLTAEGKMKPRRPKSLALLPKEAGVPSEERRQFRKQRRDDRPRGGPREQRPFRQDSDRRSKPAENFEKRPFSPKRDDRPFANREQRPFGAKRPDQPFRKREPQPFGQRERSGQNRERTGFNRERTGFDRERKPRPEGEFPRGERKPFDRPRTGFTERPTRFGDRAGRPSDRPQGRSDSGPTFRPRDGERRPFTGARPSRPSDRPQGRSDSRPTFRPRDGERRPFTGARPSRPSDRPQGQSDSRPTFRPRDGERRSFGASNAAARNRTPQSGNSERPKRVSNLRIEGVEKSEQPSNRFGGETRRPGSNRTEGRPQRFDRKPGGGSTGRPSFGAKPGGFRKGNSGFGNRPGSFRKRPDSRGPRKDSE